MTNNKVPKANILSKISDADLVLRKINLINKFSELLSTQSLDLTEFSQELNQLPVDIYSRELINKINKILSEIYLLPNGTLLYLEKKEIKQPRTKITRIIEFDNDDYLDEAKKEK